MVKWQQFNVIFGLTHMISWLGRMPTNMEHQQETNGLKTGAHWWINFFKDMSSSSLLDVGNDLHKECLWFCFYRILNEDLQKTMTSWNSHHIRPSRHDCISGSPDILYFLPERSGGVNNLQTVSSAKLTEMELQISKRMMRTSKIMITRSTSIT